MKAQDTLAGLADLERAAADLVQQPQPPRQRADIIMCDWLAAQWVRLMTKRDKPGSRGIAPDTPSDF